MTLTPKFELSQNDEFIIIKIRVPFVKISSTEIYIEDCNFTFYCKPYLLKMKLPFPIIDDERCKSIIDLQEENGTVTCFVPKLNVGQFFPELDMFTKLLSLRTKEDKLTNKNLLPSIEVLSSEYSNSDICDDTNLKEEESLLTCIENLSLLSKPLYGFDLKYNGIFENLREVFYDLIELPYPDSTPIEKRKNLRIESENELFDVERYLADLYHIKDDYIYNESINYIPYWSKYWEIWKSGSKEKSESDIEWFTPKEIEIMQQKLPRREYLVDKNNYHAILLGLVDILFSYCYDHRFNQGDKNVESAHNISRLSALLSWLEHYQGSDSIQSVIKNNVRRSLIYPYIRNYKFACKILVDVSKLVILGKKSILKALINIHSIFESSETHYILNKIYLDDYCCWIQQINEETLINFGKAYNLEKSKLNKSVLGLSLDDIEKCSDAV